MLNRVVELIGRLSQNQVTPEMTNDLQLFGEAVQTIIIESIQEFYRIPSQRNDLDCASKLWRLDSLIRELARPKVQGHLPHLFEILETPLRRDSDIGTGASVYFDTRTRLQWKISSISSEFSRFGLHRITYPLQNVVQLQELDSILREYVGSAERERFTRQERTDYIAKMTHRKIDVFSVDEGRLCVVDSEKCTVFAAWLFRHPDREMCLNNLNHFAACRAYFLCCQFGDVGALSEMVFATDGSFLAAVEGTAFFVYNRRPEGVDILTAGYVQVPHGNPFDERYRGMDSQDRIHFMSWLEERLNSLMSLQAFRVIFGPLDNAFDSSIICPGCGGSHGPPLCND